ASAEQAAPARLEARFDHRGGTRIVHAERPAELRISEAEGGNGAALAEEELRLKRGRRAGKPGIEGDDLVPLAPDEPSQERHLTTGQRLVQRPLPQPIDLDENDPGTRVLLADRLLARETPAPAAAAERVPQAANEDFDAVHHEASLHRS